MSAISIDDLTRASSFIFSGTVQAVGASNVDAVEPAEHTLLVRVERGLRTDPALGDVRGALVTVATATPGELPAGASAVFFTDSWIHGDQIAVRERAHVDADRADEVAAAVERLPDLHLADRLRDALVVVHAAVVATRRVAGLAEDRRAPLWAEATLDVIETLKGDAAGTRVVFPTSTTHRWFRAPRLAAGQRAILVLHAAEAATTRWLDDPVLAGALTAFDPADVQPESALDTVRALLANAEPA